MKRHAPMTSNERDAKTHLQDGRATWRYKRGAASYGPRRRATIPSGKLRPRRWSSRHPRKSQMSELKTQTMPRKLPYNFMNGWKVSWMDGNTSLTTRRPVMLWSND